MFLNSLLNQLVGSLKSLFAQIIWLKNDASLRAVSQRNFVSSDVKKVKQADESM